jgi:hypothetical protein
LKGKLKQSSVFFFSFKEIQNDLKIQEKNMLWLEKKRIKNITEGNAE